MDDEIRQAIRKAGLKLGIGLSVLVAVIGIRVVTATPKGVESGIAELERLDQSMATDRVAESENVEPAVAVASAEDPSIVSRLSTGIREGLPNSESGSHEGDKLVSCRMASGTQYMRADDCAMRGGRSTVFVGKD